MTMMDGRAFAQEKLMDNAALVLNAYYKAPLTTSRLNQKAVIVSGEETQPLLDVIDVLAEKVGGHEATQNIFAPLYMDYLAYKVAIDRGESPALLLLGADLAKADLGWDCGACGFATCGELTRYFKKDGGGMGRMMVGPSCAWKSLDWGIACDYACAAAWELNMENRIEGTMGLLAYALGYMEDVTAVMALPLGPVTEFWYYNRPTMKDFITPEAQAELLRNNISVHYEMFAGDLKPPMKGEGKWWERPPEYGSVGPDPEYTEFQQRNRGLMFEAVMEVRPKVEAMKKKLASKKGKGGK
jgi:uncharacterized ferredoxin-like protein